MATTTNRNVSVERTASGQITVVNNRGGQITIGTGSDSDFTPTELLLAAAGSCTAIDVDTITSRRAEPEAFQVRVDTPTRCATKAATGSPTLTSPSASPFRPESKATPPARSCRKP